MALKLPLGLLAIFVAYLVNVGRCEEKTCSSLLANPDQLADGDKRNAELCQLVDAVDNLGDTAETVMKGLVSILNDQGVKVDIEDDDAGDVDKRKSEFLRFGRKSEFLRFGKRKSEFLRFGKRKSEFLRFGKRKSEFLRFGK